MGGNRTKLKGLTEKRLDETRKKDLEVHGEIRDLANARKVGCRGRDQEKRSFRLAQEDFEKLARHETAQPFADELARYDQAKKNHRASALSLEDAVDQKAGASKDFIEATESYRICLRARIEAIRGTRGLTASINADREKAKEVQGMA